MAEILLVLSQFRYRDSIQIGGEGYGISSSMANSGNTSAISPWKKTTQLKTRFFQLFSQKKADLHVSVSHFIRKKHMNPVVTSST